jgi:hypothetical protein
MKISETNSLSVVMILDFSTDELKKENTSCYSRPFLSINQYHIIWSMMLNKNLIEKL